MLTAILIFAGAAGYIVSTAYGWHAATARISSDRELGIAVLGMIVSAFVLGSSFGTVLP